MKLPDKIRIGPYMYTLTVESQEDHGKSNYDHAYIKLNTNQCPERFAGTLFHEIAHQWLDIAGVKLPDEQEEAVIVAFEHGAVMFAKDHQKLFIDIIKEMGKHEK